MENNLLFCTTIHDESSRRPLDVPKSRERFAQLRVLLLRLSVPHSDRKDD